jgi:hypothetical protein
MMGTDRNLEGCPKLESRHTGRHHRQTHTTASSSTNHRTPRSTRSATATRERSIPWRHRDRARVMVLSSNLPLTLARLTITWLGRPVRALLIHGRRLERSVER